MKRGLDWYRREQRAILDAIRAARMTDRQAAIYNIVIDLIYDGGGETPDDPKHIASYLSNVGQAACRATIEQLVDMGKLTRVGDMLHQKRAENEAKTRQNLRETRAETGRLGGISSGKSRRETNKNKDLSEANASSKNEAEKEKRREESKIGSSIITTTSFVEPAFRGGDGSSADGLAGGITAPAETASDDRTDRELILAAIGVDPVSGLTGHGGRQIGTVADMAEARLWLGLPGLTIPVICDEIRAQMGRKRDGPPSSFRYFTQSMCRLSGALSKAPLTPETPIQNGKIRHDRQAFDRAIHSLADRLSDGTVALDHASRDPWAAG